MIVNIYCFVFICLFTWVSQGVGFPFYFVGFNCYFVVKIHWKKLGLDIAMKLPMIALGSTFFNHQWCKFLGQPFSKKKVVLAHIYLFFLIHQDLPNYWLYKKISIISPGPSGYIKFTILFIIKVKNRILWTKNLYTV